VHASSVESFFERRSAEHLTFDHRKLDRLGRRVKGLLDLANEMKGQHVHFKSPTDSIDTKTQVGRFFFHVLASLAQMEQELIVERTRAVAVSRDSALSPTGPFCLRRRRC
jgi:DNA invertase Pin-like site-specific DNA recombinase